MTLASATLDLTASLRQSLRAKVILGEAIFHIPTLEVLGAAGDSFTATPRNQLPAITTMYGSIVFNSSIVRKYPKMDGYSMLFTSQPLDWFSHLWDGFSVFSPAKNQIVY